MINKSVKTDPVDNTAEEDNAKNGSAVNNTGKIIGTKKDKTKNGTKRPLLKYPKKKTFRSTKQGGAFWISHNNYKLLREMDIESACVFITLARFTGKDGRATVAGHAALKDRLGLSDARIGEILLKLVNKNLIASKEECKEFSATVRDEILEHAKVHSDCKEIIVQHYKSKTSIDSEFQRNLIKYVNLTFDLEEKRFPTFHESVNSKLKGRDKYKYIDPYEIETKENKITWVLNNEHTNYIPSIWFGNSLVDGATSNKYPLKEILRSSQPSNIFKTLLFCYYNNNVVENRIQFVFDDYDMALVHESNGYSFYEGNKTDTKWRVFPKLDPDIKEDVSFDSTPIALDDGDLLGTSNPNEIDPDIEESTSYLDAIAPIDNRKEILNFLVKYGYLTKAVMVFNFSLNINRNAMAMYELDIKDPENRMREEKQECIASKAVEVLRKTGISVKMRGDGKFYNTYYAIVPSEYPAYIHGIYRLAFMPDNPKFTPMRNGLIARKYDRLKSREWLEKFIITFLDAQNIS